MSKIAGSICWFLRLAMFAVRPNGSELAARRVCPPLPTLVMTERSAAHQRSVASRTILRHHFTRSRWLMERNHSTRDSTKASLDRVVATPDVWRPGAGILRG
jgi:hypothetical protein